MTQIKNIKPGETVVYKGLEIVVLWEVQYRTLVITKDSIGNKPFNENDSNDWYESFIYKYLNTEFINKNNIQDSVIGEVFLLNLKEYEKYKNLIPVLNKTWWLCSPSIDGNVIVVISDGFVTVTGHHVGSINAVRPAFYLKPYTMVSCKGEEKQEMSAREYLTKVKYICEEGQSMELGCNECPLIGFNCGDGAELDLNIIDELIKTVQNYKLKYCPWCGVEV